MSNWPTTTPGDFLLGAFNPEDDHVRAKVTLTVGGLVVAPGEELAWRELGWTEETVRNLWAAGQVGPCEAPGVLTDRQAGARVVLPVAGVTAATAATHAAAQSRPVRAKPAPRAGG